MSVVMHCRVTVPLGAVVCFSISYINDLVKID